MSKECATGQQFEISYKNSKAIITELAAGLRYLELDGVQVTETYGNDVTAPMGNGIVLVPWPNRVAGGQWKLNGKKQQLDITEYDRGHAIHGLLRNAGYTVKKHDESSLTLQAPIFPQHGYPFHLHTEVSYSLDENGLKVEHRVLNLSAQKAPVAIGTHPYFRVGKTPVEDLTVQIAADSYLVADAETLIPEGKKGVETNIDLRVGQKVATLDIDMAFTDLTTEEGIYKHWLKDDAGNATVLWADESMPYVHVFTPEGFDQDQKAIAMEPMTAPANAFNSGENLAWVEAGQLFTATWGVSYHEA